MTQVSAPVCLAVTGKPFNAHVDFSAAAPAQSEGGSIVVPESLPPGAALGSFSLYGAFPGDVTAEVVQENELQLSLTDVECQTQVSQEEQQQILGSSNHLGAVPPQPALLRMTGNLKCF